MIAKVPDRRKGVVISLFLKWMLAVVLASFALPALSGTTEAVVDLPTRPGVTQRLLIVAPAEPKAAVILFAGGHGGLQITPSGAFTWGQGNFLVRTRQLFADQGLLTVVIDAPSNRQSSPFLSGFRQTTEHVADVKAVIAWIRTQANLPVWLIGTSRGTQSVAYLATELAGAGGPDGIVLTSSILADNKSRAVPAMPLDRIRIPVLVVHHELDGCRVCAFTDMPLLMDRLGNTPRKELLAFSGGLNVGDPCEARAYHGFNGIEPEVVQRIAAWLLKM
jgi:alpha/beta superfamily hydrolase